MKIKGLHVGKTEREKVKDIKKQLVDNCVSNYDSGLT